MQVAHKQLYGATIFSNIRPDELPGLLQCLGASQKKFAKNEYIFTSGDRVHNVGVIINGHIQIERFDIMGNRILLGEFGPGDLFAESFACAQIERVPVNVVAAEAVEILFIDCRRIISVCPSSCKFHTQLVENLLQIVATKNILLNQKVNAISQRSLRDKILTFLGYEAQKQGRRTFSLKFSRQELADYLCADRSAVSRELNRLKAENIIDFDGNIFSMPQSHNLDD